MKTRGVSEKAGGKICISNAMKQGTWGGVNEDLGFVSSDGISNAPSCFQISKVQN